MIPNQTQKAPKKTLLELTQEAQENHATLIQKPEISAKVEYYKGILMITARLITAIDVKINKLSAINAQIDLECNGENDYDICKLEIEKLDAQSKLVSQKQFFEMWLNRSKDFTLKFEVITQECNRDFDMILSEVKELATAGSYLEKYIDHYFTATLKQGEEKTELERQSVKNEFFLFIKLERDKAKAPKQRFN